MSRWNKLVKQMAEEAAAEVAAEQAQRWPQVDMGFGKFAVGSCTGAVTGVPGLMYLHLDEPRPHNADCSDVFPVGSTAPEDRIASIINFHSAEALQQTIDVLLELQREHYPVAEQAQQAEPVATDPAVAAIQFALETHSDGLHFLRLWNEGEFDLLRREWPEAPEDIYIGADPLLEGTAQPPAVAGAVPGAKRKIGTLPVKDRYFLCRCEKCGWIGSSEECRESINHMYGDGDYYCPSCGANGPDEMASAEATFNAMLAAAPQAAVPVCQTCNGKGMVGGLLPNGGGYDGEPCPDCNTPQAAVADTGCKFPLCQNEQYQKDLGEQLHRELCAGAPEAVIELLRKMEWIYSPADNEEFCEVCGRLKDNGHAADCRLAAVLSAAPRAVDSSVPVADEKECLHHFVMFRNECVKCGQPYDAAQKGGA